MWYFVISQEYFILIVCEMHLISSKLQKCPGNKQHNSGKAVFRILSRILDYSTIVIGLDWTPLVGLETEASALLPTPAPHLPGLPGIMIRSSCGLI